MRPSIIVNNTRGLIVAINGTIGFYDRVQKYGFWMTDNFDFESIKDAELSDLFEQFKIDISDWPTKFFPRSFMFELIDKRKRHKSIPFLRTLIGTSKESIDIVLMKNFVGFCNLAELNKEIKRDLKRWYNKYSRTRWKLEFLCEVPKISLSPDYESQFTRVYLNSNFLITFHFVRRQAQLFICENVNQMDSSLDYIFSKWKLDLKVRVLDQVSFKKLSEDVCFNNFSLISSGEKLDAADAFHNILGSNLTIKDPAVAFLHKKMSHLFYAT